MDDAKTYKMLARGDAAGVFQFESSGMREALRQVKPTEFEHLIALVALYRPGPMAYIPAYARRRNGQEPVTYIDPRLEPATRTAKVRVEVPNRDMNCANSQPIAPPPNTIIDFGSFGSSKASSLVI